MPPKRKADADPEASKKAAATKKPQAKAAEVIPRSETPRMEPACGLLLTAVHWNVAGLAGLLKNEEKKKLLKRLVDEESPDLLFLSEHKLSTEKLPAVAPSLQALLPGYEPHWAISTAKKGYSGVVALVKAGTNVLGVAIDTLCSLNEGRTLTLELDSCFVVGAYVPNSGQDLGRLKYRIDTWEPAMRDHLLALEAQGKPVLLIGDLNVAHLDADIWNVTAKHIAKSAGTTPQERAAFGTLLAGGERAAGGEGGEGSEGGGEVRFVDCFRHLYPEATGCFSYWSTRAGNQHTNRGLRLDYAVVSKSVTSASNELELHDCQHLPEFAPNGDHCPTMVSLRLKA